MKLITEQEKEQEIANGATQVFVMGQQEGDKDGNIIIQTHKDNIYLFKRDEMYSNEYDNAIDELMELMNQE